MSDSLCGLHIVPNPYVPEDTVIVGPRTFELLTRVPYEQALAELGKALKERAAARRAPRRADQSVRRGAVRDRRGEA